MCNTGDNLAEGGIAVCADETFNGGFLTVCPFKPRFFMTTRFNELIIASK